MRGGRLHARSVDAEQPVDLDNPLYWDFKRVIRPGDPGFGEERTPISSHPSRQAVRDICTPSDPTDPFRNLRKRMEWVKWFYGDVQGYEEWRRFDVDAYIEKVKHDRRRDARADPGTTLAYPVRS